MPFPNKETQFKKGESGNPNGRPEGTLNRSTIVKHWMDVAQDTINEITGEYEQLTQRDLIILAQIKRAKKGDTAAFRELMDSEFGKMVTQNDITSNGQAFNIPVIKWIGESDDE